MKKKTGFEKFFTEKTGAAKREQFRQDKRKWKKELTEKAEAKRKQVEEAARPKIKMEKRNDAMPLN